MGQGFTVKASVLQSRSQDASDLQEYCQAVAVDAVETLAGMASSAGHPGLASALTDAAGRGDKAFGGMLTAYGHAAKGLAASGQTYANAEQTNTARAKGIVDPNSLFLNGNG
jgi:hypothetical protein